MHGTLPPQTLTTLLDGDCLELLKDVPDASIDLGLCDLPYRVTRHHSDRYIDLDALFAQFRRILTPTGNLLMFAQQPHTTDLINAGRDIFKHDLVWSKNTNSNFVHSKDSHLRVHETILLFSKGTTVHKSRSSRTCTYNPQDVVETGKTMTRAKRSINHLGKEKVKGCSQYEETTNYPTTILHYPKDSFKKGAVHHSFQKPVALLEYLIRTFSNVGDIVLDPTMGSGSTGVAALNCDRHFIGMEIDQTTFREAEDRILNTPRRV